MVISTLGLAAYDPSAVFKPFSYNIHSLRENDVHVRILYCGICHSDIHYASNEWQTAHYPCVPGHEIAGRVVSVGSKVKEFKVNDNVGVGVIINSCRECAECKEDLPQYCLKRVKTYGTPSECPEEENTHPFTTGGYARDIVVDKDFVFAIPAKIPMNQVGPLLCAGATTYSPMKRFGCNSSKQVIGVVGLGGLGHMAVQFGAAWGNRVVVFTTSQTKIDIAKELGATDVVIVNDNDALKKWNGSFDLIIDTACSAKDLSLYLDLLRRDGNYVLVGIPAAGSTLCVDSRPLILQRRNITGSSIASNKEIREMLAFCAEKNIRPMTELIKPTEINNAIDRMRRNDVRFRFVLDMNSLDD